MYMTTVYVDNWVPCSNVQGNLDDIKIGASVKIKNNGERFFVKVTSVKDNGIIQGIVDNHLIREKPYDYGSVVEFKREHIWVVHTEQYMESTAPQIGIIIEKLLAKGFTEKQISSILSRLITHPID